jgi:hypothetical protein
MSRLAYMGRPWVVFDPKIKDHRRWFEEFQRRGTWGRCPVRFVTDDSGDLITMIQRSLIKYYVTKEFGAQNERRTRSVGQNSSRMGKKALVRKPRSV